MADLHQIPNLNPADLRLAELVFDFVQFLLDDDANLTPAGNLTGTARQRLRERVDELISAETEGTVETEGEEMLVDMDEPLTDLTTGEANGES